MHPLKFYGALAVFIEGSKSSRCHVLAFIMSCVDLHDGALDVGCSVAWDFGCFFAETQGALDAVFETRRRIRVSV